MARFTYSTVSTSQAACDRHRQPAIGKSPVDRRQSGADERPGVQAAIRGDVAYARAQTGYSGLQDTTSEIFSAGGRRLITPTLALLANVGYETNNLTIATTPGNGTSLSGTFWSTGLEWTPTPRTHLAATIGKRPFGNTHTLDFSHRTRLTTWSAGYSEDITTTHAQALVPSSVSTAGYLDTLFLSSVPDPAARQLAVKDFIAQNGLPPSLTVPLNFLTTQTFLVKSWQASVGIQGVRNTVLTNVFTQTSELTAGLPASVAGDFGSSSTVKQTGASALWNWRFATQNASNLGVSLHPQRVSRHRPHRYTWNLGRIRSQPAVPAAAFRVRELPPAEERFQPERRQLHGKCGFGGTQHEVLTFHVRSFLPLLRQAVSAQP